MNPGQATPSQAHGHSNRPRVVTSESMNGKSDMVASEVWEGDVRSMSQGAPSPSASKKVDHTHSDQTPYQRGSLPSLPSLQTQGLSWNTSAIPAFDPRQAYPPDRIHAYPVYPPQAQHTPMGTFFTSPHHLPLSHSFMNYPHIMQPPQMYSPQYPNPQFQHFQGQQQLQDLQKMHLSQQQNPLHQDHHAQMQRSPSQTKTAMYPPASPSSTLTAATATTAAAFNLSSSPKGNASKFKIEQEGIPWSSKQSAQRVSIGGLINPQPSSPQHKELDGRGSYAARDADTASTESESKLAYSSDLLAFDDENMASSFQFSSPRTITKHQTNERKVTGASPYSSGTPGTSDDADLSHSKRDNERIVYQDCIRKWKVPQTRKPSIEDASSPSVEKIRKPRQRSRDINGFIAFAMQNRTQLRKDNPAESNHSILKKLGRMWKDCTPDEKDRYLKLAKLLSREPPKG
eukprot:TRINITY_DN3990_c0_g1_i1.p1 TRINITY_DN3990_c0_g1~~TRINITY_DN3990_c0_g1_i1.p1  ORF type:complete len:458 (+),score=98.09 TRINITY_DN3990_c0_g1_i1:47-1420(+)